MDIFPTLNSLEEIRRATRRAGVQKHPRGIKHPTLHSIKRCTSYSKKAFSSRGLRVRGNSLSKCLKLGRRRVCSVLEKLTHLAVNKWYLTNEHFPGFLSNKHVKYRNTAFVFTPRFSQSLSDPSTSLFTWKITFQCFHGFLTCWDSEGLCPNSGKLGSVVPGNFLLPGQVCKGHKCLPAARPVHRAFQHFLPKNKPVCLMQV